MKKTVKIISAIAAASIMICAATVNTSAFCIGNIRYNNCNMVSIIQCIRNGSCNLWGLITGNTACVSGDCGDTTSDTDCQNGECESNSTQSDTTVTDNTDVNGVFQLVNKERKAAGLGEVAFSDELSAAALVRAKEIVRSFSHTRPNGTSCFTVLKESGITYRSAGENLAYGQKTANEVMNGWMNSSGHRANILNKNFSKVGIACYNFNGVKY